MAIREIRKKGDEVLTKTAKPVTVFDKKLEILLEDMADTMHRYEGAGLAAPQVGILKRVVVVDVGEGVIELVNPEIIETKGTQTGPEGCLSVPEVWGEVERPNYVKVRAQDRHGNWFEASGEGLLARAFCHETEHLDGKLFLEKVIQFID